MKSRFLDQRMRIHGRTIVFTKGIKPWRSGSSVHTYTYTNTYTYTYVYVQIEQSKRTNPESYLFKWLFFSKGRPETSSGPVFLFHPVPPPLSQRLHYTTLHQLRRIPLPYTYSEKMTAVSTPPFPMQASFFNSLFG